MNSRFTFNNCFIILFFVIYLITLLIAEEHKIIENGFGKYNDLVIHKLHYILSILLINNYLFISVLTTVNTCEMVTLYQLDCKLNKMLSAWFAILKQDQTPRTTLAFSQCLQHLRFWPLWPLMLGVFWANFMLFHQPVKWIFWQELGLLI